MHKPCVRRVSVCGPICTPCYTPARFDTCPLNPTTHWTPPLPPPLRPEALGKHQKLCTADNPMKTGTGAGAGNNLGLAARTGGGGGGVGVGGGGGPSEYADGEQEELEQCINCGRRMRPDALVKHGRLCTADKPMKALKSSAPVRVPVSGG